MVRKRSNVPQYLYLGLSSIFFICLIVQVFLAGLATFDSAAYWLMHTTFVHLFGFNLLIFMLFFAFIGKMPKWTYWHIFGLLTLVFMMYFTANMQLNWIGSLHPVLAILLIMISYLNVKKAWYKLNSEKKGEN
ncbi:hypothetical protein SAMN05216389_104145 [Oceanobacillus limi]|uniref:Uncharacterized protein n=1 Tax=Oceanobacillus limi TaxID=930131 RepID=A0A1I0B2P2_9BACI|nr:DUF6220 domain-containing protein [Oceanobacillus limi]SET00762.1 hypothetical protein SAMN05216389_104145 [Oceanobacillus limi]